MPRYKLRTLLILLAILPPLIWFGWLRYEVWRAEQERRALAERIDRLVLEKLDNMRLWTPAGKQITVRVKPAEPQPLEPVLSP